MSGFAVLYREATDHPLFVGDSARFGAWAWLVLKACWKPTKFNAGGATITIERGQLCVSRSQLATAWGWSPSAVERFLTRLQTEQMIGRATGQGRSVITICNYDKYQDIGEQAGQATGQESGQRPDSDRTAKEQGNHGTNDLEPDGSRASLDAPEVANDDEVEEQLRPEHIVAKWNELAPSMGKPTVRDITPERRKLLKARIGQYPVDDFVTVFGNIRGSPFLRGDTGKHFCTFDWAMKKANFQKILEGNYAHG